MDFFAFFFQATGTAEKIFPDGVRSSYFAVLKYSRTPSGNIFSAVPMA